MRMFFLVLGFLCLACSIFGQEAGESNQDLLVTPKIEKVVFENCQDESGIINLKLKFQIKNQSGKKLFFLKDEVNIDGVEVFRNSLLNDNLESVMRILHPPSFSGKMKWVEIGDEIFNSESKSKFLISINPGKSLVVEQQYTINVPNEASNYFSSSLSWDRLKNEKKLYLQFNLRTWNNEIRAKNFTRENFPVELNKKIKDQGALWFENIDSEVIRIDLTAYDSRKEVKSKRSSER